MKTFGALFVVIIAGCAGPENDPVTLPVPDHAVFVRSVEPILEARCSSPSCHGNDRRPLRVYAPERFRLDPAKLHFATPLDPEEVAANEASARAFALDAPSALDSLLVTKPLGRVFHQGGIQFDDANDPECAALVAWLRTGGLP